MAGFDTGLGRQPFPPTRWSLLQVARDPDSPEYRQAIEQLCQLYWKPVYGFIRFSKGLSPEEAKDLTQEFFLELLEGGMLERFRPERGNFGTYLRGAIQLFFAEQYRWEGRIKRGGGRKRISLDDETVRAVEGIGSESAQTPEEIFDLHWARSVFQHALDALRQELEASKKELYFRVLDRYELNCPPGAPPDYASVAAELGITVHDVTNYLRHCRARLRDLILTQIRDYVTSETDVTAELNRILEILSRT